MQALTNFSSKPRLSARRTFRLVSILLGLICLCAALDARAQIQMDVKLARRTYILYEPLIATVSITNLAGRDLELRDVDGKQWFNMEITTLEGNILQPYDPDYKLRPLTIPAGQTVRRQIDLAPLFPIREQGMHRVRANIYLGDTNHFYYSNFATFELTDGKVFWRQTVGVPGSNDLRQISLLTHQLPDKLLIYARVRDENGNIVYTTQSLGKMLMSGREPMEMLDHENNLHVLHESLPGAYLYTEIGLDGQRITQQAYVKAGSSRPVLAKTENGSVGVRGGQVQQAAGAGGNAISAPQPKLSDRPVGLPASSRDSTNRLRDGL